MQIEKSIVNALKSVGMPSNITVVLADRDGVEPAAPYLIIQPISTYTVSVPTRSIVHREGKYFETIYQTKEFDYALTFHAKANDETHDWVEHFDSGLESDMFDWAFVQEGLGLVRSGQLTYQPQPTQGKNYRRAIVNITFRAEVVNEYAVNPMVGVQVEGDIYVTDSSNNKDLVVDVDFSKRN